MKKNSSSSQQQRTRARRANKQENQKISTRGETRDEKAAEQQQQASNFIQIYKLIYFIYSFRFFFATKYHEHRTSTAFFPLVLAFLLAAFRFARADLAVLTADSVLELINFFFSTFNFLQHLLYYILYM